jgi:biotin transport system substrate-specific component
MSLPPPPSAPFSPLKQVLVVGFAIAAVGLSAQVEAPVPGSDVPQSLQTLAVAMVALILSPPQAAAVMIGYLAAGALGFPLFADGASGWRHLVGPTAGYLFGFAVGAILFSFWVQRFGKGPVGILGAAFGVHAVILFLGWARLAVDYGAVAAFQSGAQPFLFGGLVKSLAAASLAYLAYNLLPTKPVED